MKNYLITDNNLIEFSIITNYENIENTFEKYLNPYLILKQSNNKCINNYIINVNNSESSNLLECEGNYSYLNNMITLYNINVVEKSIKRIILDIYSRLLEKLDIGVFLHASALKNNNGARVYIGERKSGKTYNMITDIISYNCGYISNDKTFFYKENNYTKIIGIPSSIGIRKSTFLDLNMLDDSMNKYKEDDKIIMSINDFCKKFNTKIFTTEKLEEIILLSPEKFDLRNYQVPSIYDEQKFLENIIDINLSNNEYELFKELNNYVKVKK